MKKNEESFNEIQDKFNNKPKMKKNEELQNEIHYAISRKPLLNMQETGVFQESENT